MVLSVHQRLMKGQQRRGPKGDGDVSEAPRIEEQGPESAEQPGAPPQVRRTLAATAQDDQLLLEEQILRHDGAHATGTTELRSHDGKVQQREQDILHSRVSVGQVFSVAQRCGRPDSARQLAIRDRQVSDVTDRDPAVLAPQPLDVGAVIVLRL